MRDLQGSYVQPVGFEIYYNTQGSNVSLWKIEKVFYFNTSFESVEELMSAYNNGSLYKIFLPAPSQVIPISRPYFRPSSAAANPSLQNLCGRLRWSSLMVSATRLVVITWSI